MSKPQSLNEAARAMGRKGGKANNAESLRARIQAWWRSPAGIERRREMKRNPIRKKKDQS